MDARKKIRKLETISSEDFFDENDLLKTIQSAPAIMGESDALLQLTSNEDSLVKYDSTLGIDGDLVPELPNGWPKIPQLFQIHSWNFSTAVSPSINKAVGHLELLQTVIEETLRETETSWASKMTQKKPQSSKSQSRKELHFSSDTLAGDQALSIQGIGASDSSTEIDAFNAYAVEVMDSSLYLGAAEVVEETVTLLAKLETDRQKTIVKLASERETVTMLVEKIDTLAEQRLMELSVAVQNAHEMCTSDITELQLHVVYRSKNEHHLQSRNAVAAALNKKLKQDIAFLQSHIPLVEEKLDLELHAMECIVCAQDETNNELKLTEEHYESMMEKSVELHKVATQEQVTMKNDLKAVCHDLENINAECEDAKQQMKLYTVECNYHRQNMLDNIEEHEVFMVKEENARIKEEIQAATVKELREQFTTAEYDHERLAKHVGEIGMERKKMLMSYTAKQANLEKQIVHKKQTLRQLSRKNKELKMEIEDAGIKVKKCRKQHEKDEKNVQRMMKEVERTEHLTLLTEDELAQANLHNSSLREQLCLAEDKCALLEEELKSSANALQMQLKDESQERRVLSGLIQSVNADSEKLKVETRQKMMKVSNKWDEVQTVLKQLSAKVAKYRLEVDKRQKATADMEEKLLHLMEARELMEKSKSDEHTTLSPIQDELKSSSIDLTEKPPVECTYSSSMTVNVELGPVFCIESKIVGASEEHKEAMVNLDKRIDHMTDKTSMMVSKMEDISGVADVMAKSLKNSTRQIEALDELVNELRIQMDANKKLDDDRVAAIEDGTARLDQRSKNQNELMNDRREVFYSQEEEVKQQLKGNAELASHYRTLQNKYIKMKNEMLDTYNNKGKCESSIKDIKQLQRLQKRMQAALLEYFKYRGLYNQEELVRLENYSNQNGVHVGVVKDNMDICLNQIEQFLTNQFNADSIHEMAMEKVALEEKALSMER